jgi:O-antigen ligase
MSKTSRSVGWLSANSVGNSYSSFAGHASRLVVSNSCFFFYLYFVVDFFLRFSARIPGYGVIRPTFLLILIISGLLLAQKDVIKDRFDDPIFKAIFVFLGYLVFSWPLVEWPGSVLNTGVGNFVKAVVFLFYTALVIDTDQRLKWFVGVFVFCQVFRVMEPLFLNITQGYWGSSTHLGHGEFADRLAGAPADVINPNELGFVIVTAIPFLHYLLLPLGWKSKALYFALIPLLFYALILTMSRGAFVALLVVAFFVFMKSRRKFFLACMGVVIVIAAVSVMTPVQKDRYLSLISSDTAGAATVDGRLRGMINEFKVGLERPLVGHGLGTTPEAKFHKIGSGMASHNLYAELLIELGLVGFVLFLRYLYTCYRRLRQNHALFGSPITMTESFKGRLNTVLMVVFWMYAVYSINYWGLSQYYWYLFGGLVIALGRLVRFEKREDSESSEVRISETPYPLAQSIR